MCQWWAFRTYRFGVDRMDSKQDAGQDGKVLPQARDREADAREQHGGSGM